MQILVIFRGVPAFRPLYLRDYQRYLDALNNLRSWADILSFKTNRKSVGLVVSEEKIVRVRVHRRPMTICQLTDKSADIKTNGSHFVNSRGSHLVFHNWPKKIPRQGFLLRNISWKFEICSYNILRDMMAFVKTWRMDGRTDGRTDGGHFIISRPGPIGRRREIIIFVTGEIMI